MNCEPMFKEGYYMYSMPNQIFEHTIEPKINASCADTDFSPAGGVVQELTLFFVCRVLIFKILILI